MLETVLNAVAAALEKGGLNVFCEFPESLAEFRTKPVVCVGVESCKCLSSGMGEYLGVKIGKGGEADAQIYGRRLELCLCFEVFSPFGADFGAKACRECSDKLRQSLSFLPSGIRLIEMESGELRADEEYFAFRQMCRVKCAAYLLAESEGDEGEFLNFVLKGIVDNGD